MTLNNIWVFAQVANGAPTSATLELLTKARSLSSNVTAIIGGDGASAAALGEFGATKVSQSITVHHFLALQLQQL